jgi:hypothetical protein
VTYEHATGPESNLERAKRVARNTSERQFNSFASDELQALAQRFGIAPRGYNRRELIRKIKAAAEKPGY